MVVRVLVSFLLLTVHSPAWSVSGEEMVTLPAGIYKSFFKGEGNEEISIQSFLLDKYPVTNSEFSRFLKNNPRYQKDKVLKLFANEYYLSHWDGDRLSKSTEKKIGNRPVVFVSWFVARKYCESLGKRLPTIAEWEYASDGESPQNEKLILEWYGKTNKHSALASVDASAKNKYGLYGMHGMVWEHVEDFIAVMISSDSRSGGDRTDGFFCGGGSLSSKDASKYATFMRYAYRSSLKGNYASENLGFRCAKDIGN